MGIEGTLSSDNCKNQNYSSRAVYRRWNLLWIESVARVSSWMVNKIHVHKHSLNIQYLYSQHSSPEPIISEIKHHDIHDILPYHGQLSPDISYSAPPPDAYSGYSSGFSGYDASNVYSNTPASYSPGPPSGPPGISSIISSGSGGDGSSSAGPPSSYLPPNRRNAYTGRSARAVTDSPSAMLSDLMFRFLGVRSESCKRRFICELDFRNPFMAYALNYIG